ncbi:MAG TPA: nitrate/nitrite transporter [Acidobacteriaceae bacterium]|nr:nitrate/nitrite transporter [Acidobacteriaceae bacterium]
MRKESFLNSGHLPTLISAFLYFDVSFMVWVLFGPLTPFLAEQMHLSATQKGLLTAIPLLGGSFFRPILGLLADRIGGRKAGLAGLSLTLIPLIAGWYYATQLWHFYCIGFLLGIAGASFAVALPLAARWYKAEHQGLAMGIAGAGNAGSLLATFFGPRLAQQLGFHSVFALALVPVLCVLAFFFLFAKESPTRPAPRQWPQYVSLLTTPDTWRLCFLYSLTFGGFVGLSSFLTIFFHDQYHLTKVHAGDFATVAILAGSFLRPLGGWIADKIGGYRFLLLLFAGIVLCVAGIAALPPITIVVPLLFLAMGMLGMGNGSVFQIVPQRFPMEMELITGIVGAAGGIGGFFLPSAIGALKDLTGSFGVGLLSFALLVFGGAILLLEFGVRWKGAWTADAQRRTRVFAYRTSRRERMQGSLRAGDWQPAEE